MLRITKVAIFCCAIVTLPVQAARIFINEFHYDNSSTDRNEFVEIAGPDGYDLRDSSLILYNGANGKPYRTIRLDGIIDSAGEAYGYLGFSVRGIQNGPDGIALVDADSEVMEFFSYEGSFMALSGPLSGMPSVDVGVIENSLTQADYSIYRTDSLSSATANWVTGLASFGQVNPGQSFTRMQPPPVSVASPGVTVLLLAGLLWFALPYSRMAFRNRPV